MWGGRTIGDTRVLGVHTPTAGPHPPKRRVRPGLRVSRWAELMTFGGALSFAGTSSSFQSGSNKKGEKNPVMPLVLLAALLVLQGGYAPAVSALFALLLCAYGLFALARNRCVGVPLVAVLPVLVPLLYLASACARGASYTGLSAGGGWALFAAGVIVSASMAPARRRWLLGGLTWLGVATSALGLVMMDPAFASFGWSNAGRLQFFFQYANTAGIWFACVAALSWLSGDTALRRLTYLPVACLLLTQSGGALLLFAVAVAAMAIMGFRRWGLGAIVSLLSQCIFAALVFIACGFLPLLGAFLALVVGLAANRFGRHLDLTGEEHARRCARLMVPVVILLVALGGGLLVLLASSGRLFQASQTLVERVIQILDGLGLLFQSPLLGIGPGEWRHVYREVQSAQYVANAIHCGYLQLALDAGVLALVALLCVIVRGAIGLWRDARGSADGTRGTLLALLLIFAHALIDFDFQFGFVLAFLGFLVGEGLDGPRVRDVPARPLVAASLVLVAVLAAVTCWAGGARATVAARLAVARDTRMVDELASDPLAAGDRECQTEMLTAYLSLGEPDAALAFAARRDLPPGGEQALVVAQCHYTAGDARSAEAVLLGSLEREPYFAELFERVALLFDARGASEDAIERYNELAERSNALIRRGRASWLSNQEDIPLYR